MKSAVRTFSTTLLTLILTVNSSFALSCLPPDAVRLYSSARDSNDLFAIVVGRLHPNGPIAVPKVDANQGGTDDAQVTTQVRMSGRVLGETAFDDAFDRDIDVTITCLSVWCGAAIVDQDILAALRLTDDGPELEIGPCGGMAMPTAQADLDALLRCHVSGKCGGI